MSADITENDFVTIDYVGKIKGTDRIFDLTREDVAKKNEITARDAKYGAVTIVVGANHVLPGLDKELLKMKVGEKKTVIIQPDDGFGKKDASLVKLMPRSAFKKDKINPIPGLPVKMDGQYGIVQTVSGGRVKVDFNHPLAGKELEYEVEVLKKIENKADQVRSLFNFHISKIDTSKTEISIKEETAEINTPNDVKTRRYINLTEEILARDILEYIEGVKKVKFVDVFEKEKGENHSKLLTKQ